MQPDQQPDDQALRAALFNADIPVGMQQRLLARLRAAAADAAPAHTMSPAESPRVAQRTGTRDRLASVTDIASPTDIASDALATHLPEVEPAQAADAVAGRKLAHTANRTRRSIWATALALSVLALAGVGVYQWTRSASTEQLAQFTLGQLDRLLGGEAVWQTDFDPRLPELAVLQGQLRFDIRPVGFQDHHGGPVADQCRVWKLYSLTTHKVFFVFDFQHASQVPSLTRQLQELNRSSGGWSLVAMQTDGRVLVVAVEGRVDNYLYRLQSA